ncbi:hypothetical protein DL238_08115 [Alteriqipengyuania lutimaris]|uniref:Uncharacterized protein n=2 Tax=Alteriqipengyuania lutimaris TaxID=1538146 RepID=A0A395LKV9_9SPHN|nr:hypothetical protein DL238_08115 [Alteriqipengyuania lutimaris]
MNEAPALSADAVTDWVDARDIEVDSDYPVSKNVWGVFYTYLFFQEFRLSGGKLDPEPIRVKEINLIRTVDNRAAFEFTVARKQYFPADDEGCNGLFVHPEYYERTETAFIARFHNNRLEGFRDFPEWFA